jgi:apolipoprotein N-acyltransferase
MKGPRALAVCFASGILLSFAFPEPSIAPLAWVSIVPLLWLVAGERPLRGAALAFAFGFGFFGALLVWISAVGWVAWLALVLLQSVLFATFGAGWAVGSKVGRAWWVLVAPALWVSVEVLRASVPVVGFPWGELAQGQVWNPLLLGASRWGGGKAVSFLVVGANVMLLLALKERGLRRPLCVGGAAALIGLSPLLAVWRGFDDADEPLRIAIVQGNASPGVRVEDERARVRRHLQLTESLAGEDLDLVVWPESSVGIDPFRDEEVGDLVRQAARAVDAPMIVGANLDVDDEHYAVTTLLISSEGDIEDTYQKTHLVPFGEYVPARSVFGVLPMLDQIPRDAVAGDEPKNFIIPPSELGPNEIGTVISFEGDFGHLVRERVALGARVIVVATNTSTWERSWASAQHVAMSQVRAAENGVPVVHAALSGISAAIDDSGRVLDETGLYVEDTLVFSLSRATSITFYARVGEWFPIACLVIALSAVLLGARRRLSTVPA